MVWGCGVARLRGCGLAGLRGCEAAGLRDCRAARLQGCGTVIAKQLVECIFSVSIEAFYANRKTDRKETEAGT